jgi:hypothetical protein
MKRYCITCGSPTEYSTKKPLFCSSCGKSFDKMEQVEVKPVVQKTLIQKKTIATKKYIEDENSDVDYDIDNDPDSDEDVVVPDISKLEVENDPQESFKNKGEKISSLIGTSSSKSKRNKVVKNSKTSKKQILEDFAKEAGTSRKSKR